MPLAFATAGALSTSTLQKIAFEYAYSVYNKYQE